MTAEGHTVVALHSDLDVSVRDRVIDAFRSGEAKVLITTNVLARGIDVQSVSIVINYVSPIQPFLPADDFLFVFTQLHPHIPCNLTILTSPPSDLQTDK